MTTQKWIFLMFSASATGIITGVNDGTPGTESMERTQISRIRFTASKNCHAVMSFEKSQFDSATGTWVTAPLTLAPTLGDRPWFSLESFAEVDRA